MSMLDDRDNIRRCRARAGMLLVCGVAIIASMGRVTAQGYGPDDAAGRMAVPEGFEVELVAAEPVVRQPVAIDFDDRGRLWVMQYLQYPNPAGLERVEVDRYSRTIYDRVPEPPPHGPRGADRLSILEDTDGDGRMDRARDFVEGLNLASGFAFGDGGVYVLQVPYLLFYADRNRDDVPDEEPRVLLEGFGMEDAHSVANSLVWGPDGWLYGAQGSTVTARIRDIEFQQGVWRYHPASDRFELFYEGGGNTWGVDFDAEGNLLASTNVGGFVMLHGVQGGCYWKSFGKHGALHHPHAYGYFDHVPHDGFRGGHVSVGGVVYRGKAFPAEFRGRYIAGDLLGHSVYWHELLPRGSTFRSRHGGELVVSHDTWFAPSDVTLGPDGAIYVADWHDERTAHPDPDAEWDRRNGRVYAVRGSETPRAATIDLQTLSSVELVEMLDSANGWQAERARRILGERRESVAVRPSQERCLAANDAAQALRYLWAVYVSGGFEEAFAMRALAHWQGSVRGWAVRLLGDERTVSEAVGARLIEMAATDEDVRVRSQLACTARRLAARDGLALAAKLVLRDTDADDPHLPLLLWWAIEEHALAEPEKLLAILGGSDAWDTQLMREHLGERIARRYMAEATGEGYAIAARWMESAPDETAREIVLRGWQEALANRALVTLPESLRPICEELWGEDAWHVGQREVLLTGVAARLGYSPAKTRLMGFVIDGDATSEVRVEMLRVLGDVGATPVLPVVLRMATGEEPGEVRAAALDVLARSDDERVVQTLLRHYALFDDSLRARARDVLFSRAAWARAFLEEVEVGKIAAEEVTLSQLGRLDVHGDERIDELVRRHWGRVQVATPEEKLAEVRRLNNDLRAGTGDGVAGRVVFGERCGTCHKLYGEGREIGPDLTTANRHDRNYLLVSLVDPSAVIRKEFLSHVLATDDGRVLTGLLVEETPAAVTLLDAQNVRHTVAQTEVEQLEPSPTSLMPERILNELTPQQLRDLFSYLQSVEPAVVP